MPLCILNQLIKYRKLKSIISALFTSFLNNIRLVTASGATNMSLYKSFLPAFALIFMKFTARMDIINNLTVRPTGHYSNEQVNKYTSYFPRMRANSLIIYIHRYVSNRESARKTSYRQSSSTCLGSERHNFEEEPHGP